MKHLRKIKDDVRDLINEIRKSKGEELERIGDILKSKYKMTAFEILALFYNPPTLEWRPDNEHLLYDFHYLKETK